MDKSRLPNIILKWDQSIGLNTWYSEIQYILAYLGLNIRPSDGDQYDLTNAYNYLLKNNRSSWQLEASRKPKLRTYIKIHDFSKIQTLVKANITRYQRSLMTQLKCGILLLKYETDRYQGIAPENRVCKICDMNVPEVELHFVFHCPSLENVRSCMFALFSDTEFDLSNVDKWNVLSQMMNADNIVISAKCIEVLYKEWKRLVYLDVQKFVDNDHDCFTLYLYQSAKHLFVCYDSNRLKLKLTELIRICFSINTGTHCSITSVHKRELSFHISV